MTAEAQSAGRLESDYYSYMGFDPEHHRSALRHYAQYFPADGPVLELACGRGEFLDVLREAGIPASGVDSDDGMVEAARAAGHQVEPGDAIGYLEGVAPGSLGGVFSSHFLEHLEPATVDRLVTAARRALRPGGVLVSAVPNPACLAVLAYDFWKDPTHVRFYDPHLIAFFCHRAGLTVEHIGGNPDNVGGPFPGLPAPEVTVSPDLTEEIALAVQVAVTETKQDEVGEGTAWHRFGHLLNVLSQQLHRTQHELRLVRAAHENLLAALFPSNDVYVVARA